MIAFLKRRWLLLSWVLIFGMLSCVDCVVSTTTKLGSYPTASGTAHGNVVCAHIGLWFVPPIGFDYDLSQISTQRMQLSGGGSFRIHRPLVGNLPSGVNWVNWFGPGYILYFPLWIPIFTTMSWIFIRELRWRERRGQMASAPEEAAPAQ